MMLELLEIESTVRGRQSRVAAEVRAYNRASMPGPLRRKIGSLLVRLGESLRGTAERSTDHPSPRIASAH